MAELLNIFHHLSFDGKTTLVFSFLFFVVSALFSLFIEWVKSKLRRRKERRESKERHGFTWEQTMQGAQVVGKFIIDGFKPDIVITFAGSSAIFANLVLVRSLKQRQLLRLPIHMGRFVPKDVQGDEILIGGYYRPLDTARFYVLLPSTLESVDRSSKVAIIDDTMTTGSSMREVRKFLTSMGFSRIKTACFVCCSESLLCEPADVCPETTSNKNYSLPWGCPPI